MNKIDIDPIDVVLKTDQAQAVYEGKSKSYSFELGMHSFAGKLTDLLKFSAPNNPIKNKILNELDDKIDTALENLRESQDDLLKSKKEFIDMGFVDINISFQNQKMYKARFSSSRSTRLLVCIKALDSLVAETLAMEHAGMIATKKRHQVNYNGQREIRRIFSIFFKRIDSLFKVPGTIDLLQVPAECFMEEFEKAENADLIIEMIGDLTEVENPVRYM